MTVTMGDKTVTTDADGAYSFTDVSDGTYTVTPSKTPYTFSPSSVDVTVSGADVSASDITATIISGGVEHDYKHQVLQLPYPHIK